MIVAALAFVVFFACMFAYHIESRSALSEQLRVIARGKESSQDAKDALTKDASRLTSLAVAAGFFGVISGLALFGSAYLHRYGSPDLLLSSYVPAVISRRFSRRSETVGLGDLVPEGV